MATIQAVPSSSPAPAKTERKTREKRTETVRMESPNSDGTLKLVLKRTKDDSYSTWVVHSTGPKKSRRNVRGATEVHKTLEEAREAILKLKFAASKLQWVLKEKKGGFVAQPDAFSATTLPSAVSKPSKK